MPAQHGMRGLAGTQGTNGQVLNPPTADRYPVPPPTKKRWTVATVEVTMVAIIVIGFMDAMMVVIY